MKTLKVVQAIQFASEKHKGQIRRGSGLPYVTHPIIVMELVQHYKGTSKNIENLKCVALLHDVLEDTECTYFELEREFGALVASLVQELTSDEEQIKILGKNKYLMQKMLRMSQYAFTLKLLDRLSNIMDGPTKKYLKDTLEMIDYLKKNKADLTETHKNILRDLKKECKKSLEEKE